MTKTITAFGAVALLAAIGKSIVQVGEHQAYVTGTQTLNTFVQARGRAPRGQAKQLQFRAFGLLTDKKGATLCAGAWQATENEALRSLVVDFEQSNLPRIGERIHSDMQFRGALSIPDEGRKVEYRDPPLFDDLAA